MIEISLSELAELLHCTTPITDPHIRGISHDTRHLLPGNLFIAIPGATYDGHHFIAAAQQKGASAAIVNRLVPDINIPQLIVKDTIEALGIISAHWRKQFTLPLIGVTGSNGKTTLKNMIKSILMAACDNHSEQVLATEGNLNNNIGLPLMLSRLTSQHRFGVLEMGMNHFNEIAYLTHLTQPLVVVINNAAESHLEGVKTVAGVAQAKGEIFQGLPPEGVAVLNKDDAHFDYWKDLIGTHSFLTFGSNKSADVYADINTTNPITIHTPQGQITLTLPLLGSHNIMNALAATAATLALHIPLTAIKQGLETVLPAPGRMRQFHLSDTIKIIDDTYNANPFSLQAAVKTLAGFEGTKIMVLGDMKELGDHAKQLHFDAGTIIKKLGIDYLFTYGDLSAETQKSFGENAFHFTDREHLIGTLKTYLKNNLTILIKGSRSMQMEKIVESLVPEKTLENIH
jgi:UDP-N-acetylmuramoyl-tripeptide--D-alanyl-D-alanine ligase